MYVAGRAGHEANCVAFLDLFTMPVALLHRLLPGESGVKLPGRQAQSLS
jgi:hypothetical protein